MEQKPVLKLNRRTGKYELTIGVDAGIFQRELFAYATREHLDPTNPEEWQRVVAHVSRFDLWLDQPHADVLTGASHPVWAEEIPKPTPPPGRTAGTETPPGGYLSRAELRAKALELPVEQWETLLTPYPENADSVIRGRLSVRRSKERKILKALEQETFPDTLNMEKVQAIAQAVNSNGIR